MANVQRGPQQGIAKDSGKYMIAPDEAQLLLTWAKKFRDAMRAASHETRNPVTVLEKCQVRNSCEQLFRGVAARIKVNDGISNPDKIALYIRPKRLTWSPIPEPATSPFIWVDHPLNGGHLMRYRDSHDFAQSSKKAKPYGVIRMEMRIVLTTPDRGEVARIEDATIVESVTKPLFTIWHDYKDDGKVMTAWGRWVTRTNKRGPWSTPVAARIAFVGAGGGQPRKADADIEKGEGEQKKKAA